MYIQTIDRGSDRGIERKGWRARKTNGRGEKRDIEMDR